MKFHQWVFFFFYFSAENVFVCVSSLFLDKISTGWIHKVYAVWLHMDESKSFCWQRVIESLMLRDFHTISKLTVLQIQIEKRQCLVCGIETFSLLKDLITPNSLWDKMFDKLSQALEEHCSSGPSVIFEQFNFYMWQQTNQTISNSSASHKKKKWPFNGISGHQWQMGRDGNWHRCCSITNQPHRFWQTLAEAE